MNQKLEKAKNRFVIFLKEIMNVLTNILVPLVSLLVMIAELLPFIPIGAVNVLKKIEYWMFYAAGTSKDIEKKLEEKQKKLSE
jgi:predicted secreted Zn-dependent protease